MELGGGVVEKGSPPLRPCLALRSATSRLESFRRFFKTAGNFDATTGCGNSLTFDPAE
jgi:hypothetical protein